MVDQRPINIVRADELEIAYEELGPADGAPVVLLHGFPYDPRAYDEVVPILTAAGCRVIVPYLRGYGPTRFVSPTSMRSGQQAALGRDLLALLDALQIPSAALVGYDWGGRAACVAAALWPERVRCLVTAGGYNIQDIASSVRPASPEQEHRLWYQYYFHTERSGTSTTSTPSAAAQGSRRIVASCAGSFGSSGRPPGASTRRPTSGRRCPSTTPTSWTS
jgi:pimeloyl-ACP methyl ester carboxylesterase